MLICVFVDAVTRRGEGKNEGLVVGTKLGDAQAPPRVGPLWIFEGRYTAGRSSGVADSMG